MSEVPLYPQSLFLLSASGGGPVLSHGYFERKGKAFAYVGIIRKSKDPNECRGGPVLRRGAYRGTSLIRNSPPPRTLQ